MFSELFEEGVSLRRLVATFLAVLELTRLRKMRLRQDETFADIVCEAAEENPLETPAGTGHGSAVTKRKPKRGPGALLGLGLDNDDGHKRITTGEQFAIVGRLGRDPRADDRDGGEDVRGAQAARQDT